MQIQYKELPFPHVVIDNFYSEFELTLIMRELEFLTQPWKLLPPEQTGSATAKGGGILKHNNCLWLDLVYQDRSVSDILTFNRKIMDKNIMQQLSEYHYIFRYLFTRNQDSTLLSYYETADYYKPHRDGAVLTCLTHLFKEPKQFSGGELVFPEYDYDFGISNNRMIVFPSIITHAVSDICLNEQIKPFTGFGRYTISQFFGVDLFTKTYDPN